MDKRRGIFGQLMEEHDDVITLIQELDATDDYESMRRQELFDELRLCLLAHAHAEAEVFYPAIEALKDDFRGEVEVDHSEHARIHTLLDELSAMDLFDDHWLDTLGDLQARLEDHIEDEEENLFPRLREAFTAKKADALKTEYQEVRARYIETQGPRDEASLREKTRDALYDMARALDVEGRSQMNKDQLVRNLTR